MHPPKRYDRTYFDRWYRQHGIGRPAEVARAARFVLATTEHLLERPVRRVLDIGCGEAAWRAALLRERPSQRYVGVDPSEYVVARYGRSRGIVHGALGNLADLGLRGEFDLVICADVLPYVSAREIHAGLAWISEHLSGLAYLHAMTASDSFIGDRHGFHSRSPASYSRMFTVHGLTRIGPHLYAGKAVIPTLAALEGELRR
jgi:SAM-dependent methyltransferase